MAEAGRVAVIGAGAAGLVTAVELEEVGLNPTVFEASRGIGGVWLYDERIESDPLSLDPDREVIHSSMYDSLRTNLPRDLMAFRRFPFDSRGGGDDRWRRFPARDHVLTYLQRFAKRFELEPHVRLNTRVDTVTPMLDTRQWSQGDAEPTSFLVEATPADGLTVQERFDAVAVCNGHYARPYVPSLPGFASFHGKAMHSHSYRRPQAFSGLRVALLGARASGVDLAVEIASHASTVYLCDRDATGREPFAGLDDAYRCAGIERIAQDGALLLEDGQRLEEIDVLVFCTGYLFDFPFLERSDIVSTEHNWVSPLYQDIIAGRAAALAFIGLPSRIVPFPLFELQARYFAQTLTGAIALPDPEQRCQINERHAEQMRAQGIPPRHFQTYGDRQFEYCNQLARATVSPPLPPSFEAVHRAVEATRSTDLLGYRDASYPWVDPVSQRLAEQSQLSLH